jgi:hypothetical protein
MMLSSLRRINRIREHRVDLLGSCRTGRRSTQRHVELRRPPLRRAGRAGGPASSGSVVAPKLVVVVPYFLLSLLVALIILVAVALDDGAGSHPRGRWALIHRLFVLPNSYQSRSSLLASVGVAAADNSSSSSATRQ